jgi:hypothetical protein
VRFAPERFYGGLRRFIPGPVHRTRRSQSGRAVRRKNTVPGESRRKELGGLSEILGAIDFTPTEARHVGRSDAEPSVDEP